MSQAGALSGSGGGGGGAPTTNFFAYTNSNISNVTGDGTTYSVVLPQTLINTNSGYNTGTGVFTAPVTGFYFFSFVAGLFGITSSHTSCIIDLLFTAGSTQNYRMNSFNMSEAGTGFLFVSATTGFPMTSGDTCQPLVTVSNGAKVVGIFGGGVQFCSFAGALIK